MTLPNALSWSRMALAGCMVLAAAGGREWPFFAWLAIAILTDFADGALARRLRRVSAYGAQLDSWADLAVILALAWGLWRLRPGEFLVEWPLLAPALAGYLASVGLGWLKYGRMPGFHTRGDHAATVLLVLAGAVYLFGYCAWPFRVAAIVTTLAQIEKLIMTLALPAWRHDVLSLADALKLRRSML